MKLLLKYNRENIQFFEIADGELTPFFVQGKKVLSYLQSRLPEDVKKIITDIANECNLDRTEREDGKAFYQGLSFIVLESSDKNLNRKICKEFEGYLDAEVVSAKKVIDKAFFLEFNNDTLLDYGINYDGVNYRQSGKGTDNRDFNLLAYTLKDEDIMEIVGQLIGKH